MKKISFLTLTIDRFDVTPRVWESNIANAFVYPEYSFSCEFLVADNGSKDRRIIDYFAKKDIAYHRVNSENEGVAHSLNQLYLRSTGDYIVLLSNDIEMPKNWLGKAIELLDKVPDAGIAGINWGHGGVPPISEKFGIKAHWLGPVLNRVFGTCIIPRPVIDRVGFFSEEFGKYGLEDSDLNERVNRSGLNSFYIPDMMSKHVCNDVGNGTEYRKMKDASMEHNLKVFWKRHQEYENGGSLKCELPLMKGAL